MMCRIVPSSLCFGFGRYNLDWSVPLTEDYITYLANTIVSPCPFFTVCAGCLTPPSIQVAITVHTLPESDIDGKVCLVPLSSIVMNPASAVHSQYPCRFSFYEYPKDPSRKLLDVRPSEQSSDCPTFKKISFSDLFMSTW